MLIRLLIVVVLVAAACSSATEDEPTTTLAPPTTGAPPTTAVNEVALGTLVDSDGDLFPLAPDVPTGPLSAEAIAAIEPVWQNVTTGIEPEDVVVLGSLGDPRVAWLLSDILRFLQRGPVSDAAVGAFTELTGVALPEGGPVSPWGPVTDYLIAWDIEAPPGYAEYKARLFTQVEPGWQPFFDDTDANVDWRLVSWGGVLIDDRPLGATDPCPGGCIPALDDPPVTNAEEGLWYPDDAIVFGVTVNGESRAYPKNIMEVHEMVNDTLGGRRIGMPYCTLCGSAQAFFTDAVPEGFDTLVLRTSGLLARSNKVMYELETQSMFDTFLGVALTGPLREAGFSLDPVTVVTSTWADWKAAHPDTTIVARDGGRGIAYPADPLRGRDDNGPIFPVGDVDPRLAVQEQVLGVVAPDGSAIAFPVAAARAARDEGVAVTASGVELEIDAGGLRAVDSSGVEIPSHQSFWFAWSQFQPDTALWGQ
jgi:hypothetical protein